MRHHLFQESDTYKIALLIKASAFGKRDLVDNYVQPLTQQGIQQKDIIAFTLDYNEVGKAPAKFIKEYLDKLLAALHSLGVSLLYVADANYFKTLTGQTKAEPHFGYVLPCKIKGYEHMQVVLGLNHQQLIYNPDLKAKVDLSLHTLASQANGTYLALGTGIIHTAHYPRTEEEIENALASLYQHPELSCDIEGFSLRFNEAGIGTIAFTWDEHNGIAFPIDYHAEFLDNSHQVSVGSFKPNHSVRALLRKFLENYKGRLVFHFAPYDVKCLIYSLWMDHLLDNYNLIKGLEVMTARMDDTKIIAYLATNSTAGNVLGLKSLAHEFAGNWAKDDINDIRKIPLKELLQYNLVDALSTQYVKKKYYPIMVNDQQKELYETLMLPSLKTIIQMELTGMPMNREKLGEVKESLWIQQQAHLAKITQSNLIKLLNLLLQTNEMEKANAKLKTKQHPLSKFADVAFNPNSGPQLQRLLYEQMGLPVIDLTDTKQPATGADTIEKLINHTDIPEYKELLGALIAYGKVTKILNTFIPAFEAGIYKTDGFKYLHGSFNLGGTVSGRLSSSDPNMQNLPSGSMYGKQIKSIFQAPPGWIFAGADFASLEDRINALLTKDPNKLKVYTDGYDGHALRAYAYFNDQMPDIVDTVESINSIADKKSPYAHLRQESKSPTFALTYLGTWRTMVTNLGWPEEKAKKVEANYHKLYEASTKWVKDKIAQASKLGYAISAFGLRIRTPLLGQTLLGTKSTPYEAEAEGRTLGNAISGQSYGLLNSRAMNVVMEKVHKSKHRYSILPVAQIHDAGYYLIKDDPEVVAFANKVITEAMRWQDLPEIQHPDVKIFANLDLFWPSWANPITLPEKASAQEIIDICKEAKQKMK